jgi:nucleoside-diphosphate-sugar epimerase
MGMAMEMEMNQHDNFTRGKRVLVTGGGGFLGTAVAKLCRQQGYAVSSFSRQTYLHLDAIVEKQYAGDLRSFSDIDAALAEGTWDAVFHVAGLAGVSGAWQDYKEANIDGTANVILACRKHHIKNLIYTGSPSAVLGKKGGVEGENEDLPYLRPEEYLSHYGRSKAEAEKLVLAANDPQEMATVILRPHLIWGPGDPHLIPRVLAKAKRGRLSIIGKGDNKVDVTYIDNAAWGHFLAYQKLVSSEREKVAGKVYFLGDEEPVYLWSFINEILVSQGLRPVTRKIPLSVAYGVGAVMDWVQAHFLSPKRELPISKFTALMLGESHYFDLSLAKKDLGYNFPVKKDVAMKSLQ